MKLEVDGYIARDYDHSILFSNEPMQKSGFFGDHGVWYDTLEKKEDSPLDLREDMHKYLDIPELTFENSPRRCKLTIEVGEQLPGNDQREIDRRVKGMEIRRAKKETDGRKAEKQEEVSPGQYEWILDVNRAAHIAWRGLPPYTADKRRPIDECSTIDTSMVHWVMQSDGTYLTWSAQRLIDMLPEWLNYYLENDLRLQHYRHGDVYVVKYENDDQILECRSSNLLDALCKMYDRLLPDSYLKSQIDFGRWQ